MKESEVQYVHFRVGENAGQLLTTIAREHLLYNYNPAKALDALEGSFGGNCPRELTLAIIKGDMVVMVDTDAQQFVLCDFEEGIHDKLGFEKLNINEWVTRHQREIREDSIHLNKVLKEMRSTMKYTSVHKTYSYDQILKFIAGDDDIILDDLRNDENVNSLECIINATKLFIEKSMKIASVINVLQKWYPDELKEREDVRCLEYLQDAIGNFNKLMACDFNDVAMVEDDVQKFVESAREIDEVLSKGIVPVNILDNWSAGWLAPNGDYYALNGEIANMLHNQIADGLKDAGMIPEDEVNPDAWLEQQGWVKIHGNNINFAGCLNLQIGRRNVQMTSEQIQKIYEYGQNCYNGLLKVGWQMKPLSAVRFKDLMQVNPDALNKDYFEF